jgi:hypothetical protein
VGLCIVEADYMKVITVCERYGCNELKKLPCDAGTNGAGCYWPSWPKKCFSSRLENL